MLKCINTCYNFGLKTCYDQQQVADFVSQYRLISLGLGKKNKKGNYLGVGFLW
jgi:hypothetical protein